MIRQSGGKRLVGKPRAHAFPAGEHTTKDDAPRPLQRREVIDDDQRAGIGTQRAA